MPHPGLPLTPASSTDLLAKDKQSNTADSIFSLGPPAIRSGESSASSNASIKSDSSYKPASPGSRRKRPRQEDHLGMVQQDDAIDLHEYSLPPPPQRSRRIIQVKPADASRSRQATTNQPDKKKNTMLNKTSSANTAAGKKTARRTAHSIIERRRRSKMNEEFETLKNMIPACNGQAMHKLAILQAGIDYMRYLQKCVTDLNSVNQGPQPSVSMPQSQAPTPRAQSVEPEDEDEFEEQEQEEDDEDEGQDHDDVEMDGCTTTSSGVRTVHHRALSQGYGSTSTSPAILAQTSRPWQAAASNTSSTLASPAFGPRNDSWSSIDRGPLAYTLSATTSPAILPKSAQEAEEVEASATLLMLTHDRRHSRTDRSSVFSVKDLLSN